MKHSETINPAEIQHPETSWWQRRYINLVIAHLPDLNYGTLDLRLPSGRVLSFGTGRSAEPRAEVALNSYRPIKRLLRGGVIGWAESYMAGEWDSPDLVAMIRWALGNEQRIDSILDGQLLIRWLNRLVHLGRSNTRSGSRRNIKYHYDLGNEFYSLWLDPSMTYSSALFEGPMDLHAAQLNKYRRICETLNIQPGDTLLEVGCGWGGFAEVAAGEYGARVTAITLSKEQLKYASDRIVAAGLDDRVEFRLIDYRDIDGRYDHLVSIEMFEAVGEEHWPAYFEMLCERLKPGASALLQIITIEDQRFEKYRKTTDFIQRYIFPGGLLPSPKALKQSITTAGLSLDSEFYFGQHYARTLNQWQHSFLEQWPRIQPQGFDERFRRMWLFYLAYCEGGFSEGSIDVGFFKIRRD